MTFIRYLAGTRWNRGLCALFAFGATAALLVSDPAGAQGSDEAADENPTAPFECVSFEPGQVGYAQREGAWWIGSGEHALLSLGDNRQDAVGAARRLNDMEVDYFCSVEFAGGSGKLQLWMVRGELPDIVARNDVCSPIDPDEFQLAQREGAWNIEGLPAPEGGYESESVAADIIGAIQRSGARAVCLNREGSRFHYFVR